MLSRLRYGIVILGAGVLVTSVFTDALASHPVTFHPNARAAANLTVSGNLHVKRVLHVDNNLSDYGRVYAHGGEQVWKTLTVKQGGLQVTGGTTTDSLSVSGPLSAQQNATVTGALTAGTLTSNGAVTAPSLTLSANGKTGSIGLDASGNVTLGSLVASGALSAATLSAGSITSTGALSGQTVTATGAINAGSLTVTGNVDFSKATVTGLNVSGLNLQNLALTNLALGSAGGTTAPLALTENGQTEQLGVDSSGNLTVRSLAVSNTFTAGAANFSALTLGNLNSGAAALTLQGNNKTAQIGVDQNGNLTVGGLVATGSLSSTGTLTVGGNATFGGSVTFSGTGGLVASAISGTPANTGTTAPGPLSVTGSSIALNGPTTVSGGNDLSLSSTTSGGTTVSSHLNANGSRDVAGTATIALTGSYGPSAPGTATVCFTKVFANPPIVTITAAGDPSPGSSTPPKVYVTTFAAGTSSCNAAGGFTIHYTAPADAVAGGSPTIQYYYHVIGS